jgi:hypothetical protein
LNLKENIPGLSQSDQKEKGNSSDSREIIEFEN